MLMLAIVFLDVIMKEQYFIGFIVADMFVLSVHVNTL